MRRTVEAKVKTDDPFTRIMTKLWGEPPGLESLVKPENALPKKPDGQGNG